MRVKVWNLNTHDLKEEFRDEKLFIPAGKFIEMEKGDADLFYSQARPILRDGNGQQIPSSYKMLKIEPISKDSVETVRELHVCNMCKYVATSSGDLDNHLDLHADNWDEESKELAQKRKRGRPPKAQIGG